MAQAWSKEQDLSSWAAMNFDTSRCQRSLQSTLYISVHLCTLYTNSLHNSMLSTMHNHKYHNYHN